jgi:beta-mannosidase
MGEQPLYQVWVELLTGNEVVDRHTINTGLRQIRAVANDGAPEDALPYTIEVNGRKMFVNGWNWAPIDNLYGRVQLNRYQRLLELARDANCNLLRVWGGGLLEREEFYDLCDHHGILVWQEFHQSSSGINNRPPDDAEYLQYIEEQARQMIPQKRNHPSLAIWCGGNELMDDTNIPLNDSHPALARLKSIVKELDPGRLWLPTSSSGPVEGADPKLASTKKMHDVHGPWQYLGPDEHYPFFNTIDPLYHSEFGSEGAGNLYTIKRFISECYLWPPTAVNPAWVHHGSWWMHASKLEGLFGAIGDLETFVKASQWMQAEGLRYAIESSRRRQWQCSGTSPWQLNEAFPNTACTNAVDYLGLTKPAYWWVRRSYEPTHVSLRYERLFCEPGANWVVELWASNVQKHMSNVKWKMDLVDLAGVTLASNEGICELPDNGSIKLADISQSFPRDIDLLIAIVTLTGADGQLLSRNDYVFTATQPYLQPFLYTPLTELQVVVNRNEIDITNIGHHLAMFVQMIPVDGQWISLDDDYYLLRPGERKIVTYIGRGDVQLCAWNTPPLEIHLDYVIEK